MRVLVGCEESGVVRDAFIALGHDAWSCDILPRSHPKHITGDVLPHLGDGWDLMIAHPPCTRLTTRGRYRATAEQCGDGERFFMELASADITRIAIENPKGVMSTRFRRPDQIIHPWQFGHRERKATCLWLKNLPLLNPTRLVDPEEPVHIDRTTGKRRYSLDYLPGNVDRGRIRSRTFTGIARAMAEQWGGVA